MTDSATTVRVSTLPDGLYHALGECGIHSHRDVELVVRDAVSIQSMGTRGGRAYAAIVPSVATRTQTAVLYGSWGGPSPFSSSRVDSDSTPREIPADGAIITGIQGGVGKTLATVYVRPLTFVALVAPAGSEAHEIAAVASDALAMGDGRAAEVAAQAVAAALPKSDLTDLERRVLYCYGALKSGQYRRTAILEIAGSPLCAREAESIDHVIDGLVGRGYLKRARNGAVAMTTQGKAARLGGVSSEVW